MQMLFSGHNSCLNRGCEAFVRTTAEALRGLWPSGQVQLPSRTPHEDRSALDDLGGWLQPKPRQTGIHERLVTRLQQGHGRFRATLWPGPYPRIWDRALDGTDLVIPVGGDTYSLDYGVPTGVVGFDGFAAARGVPVILWGASVGPFGALPGYERAMARGLAAYRLIGARESLTHAYLADELGLDNVAAMVDPAFALAPEPLPASAAGQGAIDEAGRIIGVNLSDLVAAQAGGEAALARVVGEWMGGLLGDPDTVVVLIPHVANPRHPGRSDGPFMQRLMARIDLPADQARRVVMADGHWRAGQYKQLVAGCDLLVAARTHLTIAGFSQGIPTVSLGYSQKARGLNRDIYGTERFHVAAAALTAKTLDDTVQAAFEARETLHQQSMAYTQAGLARNQALLAGLAPLGVAA